MQSQLMYGGSSDIFLSHLKCIKAYVETYFPDTFPRSTFRRT